MAQSVVLHCFYIDSVHQPAWSMADMDRTSMYLCMHDLINCAVCTGVVHSAVHECALIAIVCICMCR